MRGSRGVIALSLFSLTVLAYAPLGEAGFVNYDDPGYVYANPRVAAGLTIDGVAWAFTTFHQANWHPLTWLSHMLDVELFGVNPGWHHRVAVFLHALNTVLLFTFLSRATGARWPSAFAAALFAVHPLHVESVAWISERKDVLSTFFWLAAMLAYLSWVRRGGPARYALVAGLLAAGLLAKPMVVTLPCVLLLLDVWPLGRTPWAGRADTGEAATVRWGRLLAEKVPLFFLVAGASVATLAAQRAGGAVIGMVELPLAARLANAVVAYGWYLRKTVWPVGLAVFYPHPSLGGAPPPATWLVPLLVLAGISAGAFWQRRRRPYLAVGWLWYLGTLVPVIGLVQVGVQATADRYTYVPLIGLFVAIAWLGASVALGSRSRRVGVGTAAIVWLVASLLVTRAQLPHWRSARTLAERSVSVSPQNFVMSFNLAMALEGEGDVDGARRRYWDAIRIQPTYAETYGNLARVLVRLERPDRAIRALRAGLRVEPGHVGLVNNLVWLLATHPDDEVRDGAAALALAEATLARDGAGDAQWLDTLAAARAETGDYAGAVEASSRAAGLARGAGNAELAVAIEARGRSYREGRPHRDPAP